MILTCSTEGHLILTLDYSSTMALVQLEVLNQLEKATGKRIVDMFEWIVASGVSGFLMMAMIYGTLQLKHSTNSCAMWLRTYSRLQVDCH